MELIRLIPSDHLDGDEHGVHVWRRGQVVEGVSRLMEHAPTGWRVAGIGWLPRPGWPRQREMVVDPGE